MPTFALAAAGAGMLSAAFHATLLTGSLSAIMFAYLAQLPLFLIGLWMGAGVAALAACVAIVALAIGGGLIFASAYLLADAAPALAMTWLAQHHRRRPDGEVEWLPAGWLVTWLVSLAAAGVLAGFVLLAVTTDGAEDLIRRFIEAGFRAFAGPELEPATASRAAAAMARFFPGVIAASWIAMVAVNGALAQGLLVRLGRNLRPSPAMADIDLPGWMRTALAIALIGAFLPGTAGFLGGNVLVILAVGYALAGLGVIHVLLAKSPGRGPLLAAAYAFLFLFGWPVAIAALLGLAEPWLNLRRRAAGRRGT